MKKATFLILISIVISVVVYSVLATFSENREYRKISLDYYVLTPDYLVQLSEHCESAPRFKYSSADGPKPVIVQMHCNFDEKMVNSFVDNNSFEKISDYHIKNGATEIKFTNQDSGKIVLTTVYEHL